MMSNQDTVDEVQNGELEGGLAVLSYVMVLLSAVLITLESMPNVHAVYHRQLIIGELALSTFFVVEYYLRIRASPQPMKYVCSFWGIIDLLSIIPIGVLIGTSNPLKTMRLLRLARLFKLFRIGGVHSRLVDAFIDVREEITVFICMALGAVFLSAVGIYHFENVAQPDKFSSIPASMWWAVATLTTVGYGDVFPITVGGKIFTSLTLLVGISLIAVPTGLFSAALLKGKKMIDE